MRWLLIYGIEIVGLGRAVQHSLGLMPICAGLRGVHVPVRLLGVQNKEIQSHEIECIHCVHIEFDCGFLRFSSRRMVRHRIE